MDHVGIDLHKRDSQICWLHDTGEVREVRIRTTPERFEALFGGQAPAQILIEASTESEWVARYLERLGHVVVVVDPNYAPMYPRRRRRQKNDQRDALALATASRTGTYRAVHRVSAAQRAVRQALTIRDTLVQTRTRGVSVVRSLVRGEGLRVASGQAEGFVGRVAAEPVPEPLATTLAPLLTLLTTLEAAIGAVETHVRTLTADDARVHRLQGVPGVGWITATAFVAAVDGAGRFADAGQLAAYLGLVPRDRSSGEGHRSGPITKTGPSRIRWLLVQAGWRVLRATTADAQPLRRWGLQVAERRGTRVAVIGLARRLARILYALLRDGTAFDPMQVAAGRAVRPAA